MQIVPYLARYHLPSPAPRGPGPVVAGAGWRDTPVRKLGPVGVILYCSEAEHRQSARALAEVAGREAPGSGAEVGILLDQVQVASTIIVGPGVSGTVYGTRTVQWRVASRFVGTSLAPVPTSMRDSMVRGSSENKYMLALRCRTYVSYRIGR